MDLLGLIIEGLCLVLGLSLIIGLLVGKSEVMLILLFVLLLVFCVFFLFCSVFVICFFSFFVIGGGLSFSWVVVLKVLMLVLGGREDEIRLDLEVIVILLRGVELLVIIVLVSMGVCMEKEIDLLVMFKWLIIINLIVFFCLFGVLWRLVFYLLFKFVLDSYCKSKL